MSPITTYLIKSMRFFKVFCFLLIVLCTLDSSAHTLKLTVCKLKYEQNGWTLYVKQKTRSLRDAIYSSRPDLKGRNLNSEAFLNATTKYISQQFSMSCKGKALKIKPKHLKYNGRDFEGQFLVQGLANHPEYLKIEASGVDMHAHSMKILSISVEEQEYLYNFNENQKQAIFSFDSKRYVLSEDKISRVSKPYMYYLGGALLIVLLMSTGLFRNRVLLR